MSALRGIAPFGGRHPSRCDDGVKELVIGDFGPRWRLLGFVTQNSRIGTVGPCYANTGVSGRRSEKPREYRKLTQGHRAMCVFGTVRSVAARVCRDEQILLAARVHL